MNAMLKKFRHKYKLPEQTLNQLLSHMEEVHFAKGDHVIHTGDRNTNLYLIKEGFWRAYYLAKGVENSLWFVGPGELAFSSWGYVDGDVSWINIESVNDSAAYCISRSRLNELFSQSLEMANFGRKLFEREILAVDSSTYIYSTLTAKERYLTLMEENPELLQGVPLKYLASYLSMTPQSLSRIRAGLRSGDERPETKEERRETRDEI